MTTRHDADLDRILAAFLAPGPETAPDSAIDDALARVAGERQRRPGVVAGRFHVPVPVRVLAIAAILVALLAGGVIYLGSRPAEPVPQPTPPVASPAAPSPATTPPVASPSPTARPAPTAAPSAAVSPVRSLAQIAVRRLDAAIEAARGPGGPVSDDQLRLMRLTDEVRTPLLDGDLAGARQGFEPLPAAAADVATRLEPAIGAALVADTATLGGVLAARPLVAGALEAGTYHTTAFPVALSMALPAGWSRRQEDAEVLVLEKEGVTLGVHRAATEAAGPALLALLGRDEAALDAPVAAVSLPSYPGVTGGFTGGGGTLWVDERLDAFDAAPADTVRAWILQAGPRPLTVELVGDPAAVAGLVPEVEAMLGSLVAP